MKENLSVEGFMQAFGKFLLKMQARANVENVSRTMVKENFSVPQKVRYLQEILQTEQSFNFSELFNESTSKNELITTFIAVLELLKLQYIFVKQKWLFEDFIIEKRPDAQDLQVNLEGEYEQTE